MSNDFAGLAGLAIGTIGTVLIAGEVIKAVKHTARQAQPRRQPPRRRSPPKRKSNNNLGSLNIKW